jgi:hypothetical protein
MAFLPSQPVDGKKRRQISLFTVGEDAALSARGPEYSTVGTFEQSGAIHEFAIPVIKASEKHRLVFAHANGDPVPRTLPINASFEAVDGEPPRLKLQTDRLELEPGKNFGIEVGVTASVVPGQHARIELTIPAASGIQGALASLQRLRGFAPFLDFVTMSAIETDIKGDDRQDLWEQNGVSFRYDRSTRASSLSFPLTSQRTIPFQTYAVEVAVEDPASEH